MLKASGREQIYKKTDPLTCIAKTEQDGNGHSSLGMSVYEHSLLTAWVAKELLRSRNPIWDGLTSYMVLLAGLHDIGKISPTFQRQIAEALDGEDRDSFIRSMGIEDCRLGTMFPRHDEIGYASMRKELGEDAAYIIGAHHGSCLGSVKSAKDQVLGGESWQASRLEFLKKLCAELGVELPFTEITDAQRRFISGLVSVSDWLSSSISSERYRKQGNTVALDVVRDSGMIRHSFKHGLSFKDIFGFEPRKEQQQFIDAVTGPGTYILEAEMGSGKTEAALYASYKLISSGKAEGLYFALPTTITSKQINERVNPFLKKISDEDLASKLVFSRSVLETMVYGEGSPGWFDSRKRLILAPFGVGTIDQALMSVINVRHSDVRSYGLAGKVLILDEIHSYDDYTSSLVCELVKQSRSLGCTVIILSATLRTETKRRLLGLGPDAKLGETYPMISSSTETSYEDIPVRSPRHREIELRHLTDDNEAVDEAIMRAERGDYVLWIENTVDEAQGIYRTISARCQGSEIETGLLHSRFIDSDRKEKERRYIAKYSKESPEERKRNPGFILIGTQILEQSLDIDADVLFTRICPVDMLFQRLGRLWRHERNHDGGKPVAYLMHPSIEAVESENVFGLSGAVYSPYVLYRTLEHFFDIKALVLPDDIRSGLEAVYCERHEEINWVKAAKVELGKNKEMLKRLASLAQGPLSTVRSDQERSRLLPGSGSGTRYSEYETRDMLLLSAIDYKKKTVTLLTGETLSIDRNRMSAREKGFVSLKLEESMITVGRKKTPNDRSAVIAEDSPLRYFVFLSQNEDERPMGLLVDHCWRCKDFSANLQQGAYYSKRMGYYMEKRDDR